MENPDGIELGEVGDSGRYEPKMGKGKQDWIRFSVCGTKGEGFVHTDSLVQAQGWPLWGDELKHGYRCFDIRDCEVVCFFVNTLSC